MNKLQGISLIALSFILVFGGAFFAGVNSVNQKMKENTYLQQKFENASVFEKFSYAINKS